MKKILFTAVSALALVAVAADSTEFGVLYVPSTDKETIVSVPWLESGTGNDVTANAVKVADFVLTAGLAVDDELKYYDGTQYKCWKLAQDGDVKRWVPGVVVSGTGKNDTPGSEDQRILRGQAIILNRANPGAGFYIMGKPVSVTSGSMSLPTGTKTVSACALIAPPSTTATTVGSLVWSNLKAGKDYLIIGSTFKTLTWFGQWEDENGDASGTEIPAGYGVWFMSRGGDEGKTKTVSWK